jgi:hypothetical protein
MKLFILQESKVDDRAEDLIAFRSLESLLNYVEPLDVDAAEYRAFDTDGQFYSLRVEEGGTEVTSSKLSINAGLGLRIVREYMNRTRLGYDDSKSIAHNALMLLSK